MNKKCTCWELPVDYLYITFTLIINSLIYYNHWLLQKKIYMIKIIWDKNNNNREYSLYSLISLESYCEKNLSAYDVEYVW